MKLFDDEFDIFNDEQESTIKPEIRSVPVSMTGTKGTFKTLEDLLETDAGISVSLDLLEETPQADLSFNHRVLKDMAYFGSVYAIAKNSIDKIKAGYPNGFTVVSAATGITSLLIEISNAYMYGSGGGVPQDSSILNYTVDEIIGGSIYSSYTIVDYLAVGGSYFLITLDGQPGLGGIASYNIVPTDTLINPFVATLNQYEKDLLFPPVERINYWPRDAISNNILNCEGSFFETFVSK